MAFMTHRPQESRRLFFEKTVNSFPKLMEEVDLLDLDSGIRTFGDLDGKKKRQFVFITRSPHDNYTLMVYGVRKATGGRSGRTGKGRAGGGRAGGGRAGGGTTAGGPFPDKRLVVKEFTSKEDLGKFMHGLLSRPVKAFIY
jgi:hypothetical protein